MSIDAASADQNDPRLDDLFNALQQTTDSQVVNRTETRIWQIWSEHQNEQIQERLAQGTAAMDENPSMALLIFNDLVVEVPDFAEAWNKRATLFYLLGEFAASTEDIQHTLELEPRHFGALSGLGLIYLTQDQYSKARSAFEAVLLIHPNSSSARRNIEAIDQELNFTITSNQKPNHPEQTPDHSVWQRSSTRHSSPAE